MAEDRDLAKEVRQELVARIRNDEQFAQALIEDPVGPIEGTELARKLDALQSGDVQGYLGYAPQVVARPVVRSVSPADARIGAAGIPNLRAASDSQCCVTVIY